eukprot:TRINITY_DN15481_c0_g1_i1.p2 TRINITY_DN15481_c0_g1~~TRINITY_DN15481_c0_g1_i1.p2  ORF type:complete len:185 (-),score=20.55 TRINITY_DN15481_c0_g1_i1:237-791(-)
MSGKTERRSQMKMGRRKKLEEEHRVEAKLAQDKKDAERREKDKFRGRQPVSSADTPPSAAESPGIKALEALRARIAAQRTALGVPQPVRPTSNVLSANLPSSNEPFAKLPSVLEPSMVPAVEPSRPSNSDPQYVVEPSMVVEPSRSDTIDGDVERSGQPAERLLPSVAESLSAPAQQSPDLTLT